MDKHYILLNYPEADCSPDLVEITAPYSVSGLDIDRAINRALSRKIMAHDRFDKAERLLDIALAPIGCTWEFIQLLKHDAIDIDIDADEVLDGNDDDNEEDEYDAVAIYDEEDDI